MLSVQPCSCFLFDNVRGSFTREVSIEDSVCEFTSFNGEDSEPARISFLSLLEDLYFKKEDYIVNHVYQRFEQLSSNEKQGLRDKSSETKM